MRKLYIVGLVVLAAILISLAWADQMTFSTYYPAPYGVYREMRAVRMAIGDNFHEGGDYPWDEDGFPDPLKQEIHQDADLVVDGNLGIGTNTPQRQLHVHNALGQGQIVISGASDGSTYSALYFDDEDPTAGPGEGNLWAIAYKKLIGDPRENALYFARRKQDGT